MTEHDKLVKALVAERFTKHRRRWAYDATHEDPAAWLRLKELKDSLDGEPDDETDEETA